MTHLLRRVSSSDRFDTELGPYYEEEGWQAQQQRSTNFMEDLIDHVARILTSRLSSNDQSLTELRLVDTNEGAYYFRSRSRFRELLTALESNSTLERVCLGDRIINQLSTSDCSKLLCILMQMNALKELRFEKQFRFQDCRIPVSALRNALKHSHGLERLGLAGSKSENDPGCTARSSNDISVIEFADVLKTATAIPKTIEIGLVQSTAGLNAIKEMVRDNDRIEELVYYTACVNACEDIQRLEGEIAMYLCLNQAGRARLSREGSTRRDRFEVVLEASKSSPDSLPDDSRVSLGAVYLLIRDDPTVCDEIF